jgi:DNA polymerase III epsilon subunit-like protein
MKYLIYDCETSGFPLKGVDAKHPKQACVIQLAAAQFDEDFTLKKELYSLIKLPSGKVIDPGAQAVHGIRWDDCNTKGREPFDVFLELGEMMIESDNHICHNKKFDDTMCEIEFNKLNMLNMYLTQGFCTMELMTDICKLPHVRKNSFGTPYKWPKLKEAYKFIFGEEPASQHDSLGDIKATAKIFQWLVENKHVFLDTEIITLPNSGIQPA